MAADGQHPDASALIADALDGIGQGVLIVDADGRIVFNTAEGRVKDRYLVVGAPVCISATRIGNDYEAITVRGTVVERTTEGADAVIDALAKKYLDADAYPYRRDGEVRVTIRVEAV